jgi:uncharacterized protein YjbI with pentapeptide repeats
MTRAVFENCDFSGAQLIRVDASETVFRTAQVISYAGRRSMTIETGRTASFARATIENSTFAGARLNNASMIDVKATNVDFTDANLSGARFEGCTLSQLELAGAKLQDADFSQTEGARDVLPDWAMSIVTLQRRFDAGDLLEALRQHEEWLAKDGRTGTRLIRRGMDMSSARLNNRNLSGCSLPVRKWSG